MILNLREKFTGFIAKRLQVATDNVLNEIPKTKDKVNLGDYRATILLPRNAFPRPSVWSEHSLCPGGISQHASFLPLITRPDSKRRQKRPDVRVALAPGLQVDDLDGAQPSRTSGLG